ncbi:unnamed protein product [Sphagnum jensenii]|uniref:beta-ketoacyl-[acyl-carrier-protein] synthase I n=1 Tax=Sphagnum jensenii TaxID=128206 RepID=A0ABP1BS77_9BRYO
MATTSCCIRTGIVYTTLEAPMEKTQGTVVAGRCTMVSFQGLKARAVESISDIWSSALQSASLSKLAASTGAFSSVSSPAGARAAVATVSTPKRETDPKKRVVITGMGLVSKATSMERRRLDDSLRYALVSGKRALENAGLGGDNLNEIDKQQVGVLVRTGMGGLTVFSDGVQVLVEKGYKQIAPFFVPYAITNMGSALLAIDLGLMGPKYSISTACATSNYYFYAAANHIRQGEADVMVAGGTEAAIIPVGLGGFVACRALSQRNDNLQTASRPWDKDREGFVMGEGAGVLFLLLRRHFVVAMFDTLFGMDADDPPETLATLELYWSVFSSVGVLGDQSDGGSDVLPIDWSDWLNEFLSHLFTLLVHLEPSSKS